MNSLVEQIQSKVPTEFYPSTFSVFLEEAEEVAGDSEFALDGKSAKKLADLLEGVVQKFEKDLRSSPVEMARLRGLIMKLRWTNAFSLDSNLKKDLVSFYMIQSMRAGADVFGTIKNWLSFYEQGLEPDTIKRSGIINLLNANQERIGAGSIQLKTGETVAPTVQNWIKDYVSSMPLQDSIKTGAYTKINYFSTSTNIKALSQDDRELVSKVIDIYRYLKNPATVVDRRMDELRERPTLPTAPLPPPVPKPQPLVENHGAPLEEFRKKIQAPAKTNNTPAIDVKEFEREVRTTELPPHKEAAPVNLPTPAIPKPQGLNPELEKLLHGSKQVAPASSPKINIPKPAPAAVPQPVAPIAPPQRMQAPPAPKPAASVPVREITMVDDLKKIDIAYLRSGNPIDQINNIKHKVSELAYKNNLIPFYTVNAFEQSPLFKEYLAMGSAKMVNQEPKGTLTTQEFEALADLRKYLETL